MSKKASLRKGLCLLTASLLLLGGCSSKVTPTTSAVTLPPASSQYTTPYGTGDLTYEATVTLYLPSADGQSLLAEYVSLSLDRLSTGIEEVVSTLLAYPANSRVRSLGGGTALSLYGKNPVELSGGVCTVNLSSSALQLEHEELYTVCLSLAATLAAFRDVSYVNVLVCDQSVGLDVAGYLPVGAVTAHLGEELPTLWELMDARRTPLGESAADTPLSATATLYFPTADGTGIMPETRNITFSGQTPSQLASGLLTALSSGAQYLTEICTMPDITSLLTQEPVTSEQADGSRLITLHFTSDLESRLELIGIEPMCFTAAVVTTLTTFIPSVSSVCIVSGSTMMTSLYSRSLGSLTFHNGNQKRSQYIHLHREQVSVYLAQDGLLVPVTRTVAASDAESLPLYLVLLSEGPTQEEAARGITATVPSGWTEEDVLGMAVDGDTLLLHLTEKCALGITHSDQDEQLLCYSLVTTLCRAANLKRVRFWFAGDIEQTLAGDLYWGGEFILNPGMIRGN